MTTPLFDQIALTQDSGGSPKLFALGEDGLVYRWTANPDNVEREDPRFKTHRWVALVNPE